jgi:hypothetical protein
VIFWNVNGVKLSELQDLGTLKQLSEYDIICLSETRHLTSTLYAEYFPDFGIFDKPATQSVRGQGMMVLVSLRLKEHAVAVADIDPHLQVVCIKLDKALFGSAASATDLYISSVYIPPVGSPQLRDMSLIDSFMHLTNICQMVHASGGVHLLGGDFNAHIDHSAGLGTDAAGRHLMDLVSDCSLQFMLETSRENPTFRTHRGGTELRSCPDHVVGSIGLHEYRCHALSAVCSDVEGSDHYPVDITLSFSSNLQRSALSLNEHHPRLKWRCNEAAFVQALDKAVVLGQFDAAIDMLRDVGVDMAMDQFMQTVMFAAIQSDHTLHTPKPSATSGPTPTVRQAWFDVECKHLRWGYHRSLRQHGHGHPETRAKANTYRSACRKKHRQWREAAISDLIQAAKRDPKAFWRKTSTRNVAPVATTAADVQACISFF